MIICPPIQSIKMPNFLFAYIIPGTCSNTLYMISHISGAKYAPIPMATLAVAPGDPVVLNAGPLFPAEERNVTPRWTIFSKASITRLKNYFVFANNF
jgi:hypothetical protein